MPRALPILICLCLVSGAALASSAGRVDRTGSPINPGVCGDCHGGGPTPTGILTGLPAEYQPGETYQVQLSVEGGAATVWGFCIESLDGNDQEAGTVMLTEPDRTQLNHLTQVYHTFEGHWDHGWTYQWTAPPQGTGPVTFYLAFNSANDSGDTTGDGTNQLTLTVSEASGPTPTVTMPVTLTVTATETTSGITSTVTPSTTPDWLTPTPTLTSQVSATATSTSTPVETSSPTSTPTFGEIELELEMPGNRFSAGDDCYLDLLWNNRGASQEVDLYVLLDVFGSFWSYPSWRPLTDGLDKLELTVPADSARPMALIPNFLMPQVPSTGPFYFYAAMFKRGRLDLEHLASNGAVWEFNLGEEM